MFLMKIYLMLQHTRLTAFTVSELLKENQQGKGKRIPHQGNQLIKDNIWGADLADIQLIREHNKEFQSLLCVINIFSKYAWVVPWKGITIVNACQKILNKSRNKSNKYW